MKTAGERRAHGRLISRRVTARINAAVPKELGRWDPAWQGVEEPSGEFLDALDAWIAQDSPEGGERVQAAAEALVRAWQEAAALYAALFSSEALKEVTTPCE